MDLIVPDWTFFVQIGVFLFLLVFLSKVLFKPVMKVLEEREEMHKGPSAEAARLKEEVDDLKKEVYGAIALAKEEAEKTRGEVLSEARKTEAEILAMSKKETTEFLEKSRKEVLAQVQSAKKDLKSEGEKLGKVLADKLVASGGQGGAS